MQQKTFFGGDVKKFSEWMESKLAIYINNGDKPAGIFSDNPESRKYHYPRKEGSTAWTIKKHPSGEIIDSYVPKKDKK